METYKGTTLETRSIERYANPIVDENKYKKTAYDYMFEKNKNREENTAISYLGNEISYGEFKECSGWTNIFIYPGYKFKAIDYLITNFHLPKSTLVMLVSALAGRENILNAYNIAVKERYRFFSFGDAMLIK